MTTFRTLTVLVDVKKGCEESLNQLLVSYGDIVQEGDPTLSFNLSETIHFARWVLVDPPVGQPQKTVRLAFCCHFDDIPQEERINEVVRLGRTALDQIYSLCEGYPNLGDVTDNGRQRYLMEHLIEANAIFVGAPDRTLNQIRDEAKLRNGIEQYLNTHDFSGKRPLEVVTAIQEFVSGEQALSWSISPAPPRRRTILKLALFAILALFSLPLFAVWLLILRFRYESTDQPLNLMPSGIDPRLLQRLERIEDILLQNQFSQLMEIKPGRFRLLTLKMVLWTTNFLSRNFFTKGQISQIPSIHFASWTIIDNGTRLLFQSNFDGSWDSYLGDFIDKAAFGLNAFLSNCTGFPKTHFLFFKGVSDVEHYKAWARNVNIPTQVWYTAYPMLNVKNVNFNSQIRLGLRENMTEADARQWLQLL